MRLVFVFVAFVGSVATSGSVGTLSKFFIGNNMLLKLLITFSLSLNKRLQLFKKRLFSSPFKPFFNLLAKLVCLLSAPSIDTCP